MDVPKEVVGKGEISGKAVRFCDGGYALVQTEVCCLMCGARDTVSIEGLIASFPATEQAKLESEEVDIMLTTAIRLAGWIYQPSESPVLKKLILFSLCPACAVKTFDTAQVSGII